MIWRIFRTSWQHIFRTPFASLGIVSILTGLFLTFFIGFFLIQQAEIQRQTIIKKFTYPIFLSSTYSLEDTEVKNFIETIKKQLWSPEDIEFIHKDAVLDMQIARDPSILQVLGGENPLNDIIMIPLYGVNITYLLSTVQTHIELFDSVQSMEDVELNLLKFQSSLAEIQRLTRITTIFLQCIGLLMFVLMIVVIRLHTRIFQDEQEVCRLVGASPFFYWSPHVISIIFYILVSASTGAWIFIIFRTIFSGG